MRGKVIQKAGTEVKYGITPAYAGKSQIVILVIQFQWDHPRLCGEKLYYRLLSTSGAGSPPPMRGKGQGVLHFISPFRITPAYAGKSGLHDVLPVPAEDHPRLCGEK